MIDIIKKVTTKQVEAPIRYSLGTATGDVQTLTMRRGLKFTLYDSLFDRAISCYMMKGQEDKMRDIWGKRAVVSGKVGREPEHGRTISVRDITDIRVISTAQKGSWRKLRGIIPYDPDDEPVEILLKRAWCARGLLRQTKHN